MGKKTVLHFALLKEFKDYLTSFGYEFEEEVVFSKIMPTKRQYRADYCILKGKIIIEIKIPVNRYGNIFLVIWEFF